MSDTIEQIDFDASYWLGGSADLSSENWATGFYRDEND